MRGGVFDDLVLGNVPNVPCPGGFRREVSEVGKRHSRQGSNGDDPGERRKHCGGGGGGSDKAVRGIAEGGREGGLLLLTRGGGGMKKNQEEVKSEERSEKEKRNIFFASESRMEGTLLVARARAHTLPARLSTSVQKLLPTPNPPPPVRGWRCRSRGGARGKRAGGGSRCCGRLGDRFSGEGRFFMATPGLL